MRDPLATDKAKLLPTGSLLGWMSRGNVQEHNVELQSNHAFRSFATGTPFMSNQLIPPPELAPPSVKHLPLEKRIELWEELVDENEALLLADLRAKIGPDGDLRAAYRKWYSRHMEEHGRTQMAMLANLSHREAAWSVKSTRDGSE